MNEQPDFESDSANNANSPDAYTSHAPEAGGGVNDNGPIYNPDYYPLRSGEESFQAPGAWARVLGATEERAVDLEKLYYKGEISSIKLAYYALKHPLQRVREGFSGAIPERSDHQRGRRRLDTHEPRQHGKGRYRIKP